MKHLRIFLAAVLMLTNFQSAWSEELVHLGKVPVPEAELNNLVPGQEYHQTLPDGSTLWGNIMGPDESPDHKLSFWVKEITPPGANPAPANGGKESAPQGPGTGSGPDLGGAIGAGAIAGLGQIGIEAIYNGLIMTPSKRTEYENAQKNYDKSSADMQAASNQLNHDFSVGMSEAAKAVKFAQNSLNVPADWHPISGPLPPGFEAKQALDSAPVNFRSEAQPLFDQINGVRAQTSLQSNAQKIGNAAIESGADAATQGDKELSQTYLGIAKQMANLLVGLDPITGTARFGYELFSGKNMITGEELGSWERAFSGAAFAASLVTLGTSATMISAVKGCLGVMETMKGAGLVAGIASLRESKAIADTLRGMGWAEKEITNFSKFNRTVMNGAVKDLDYSVYAYKAWTPAAKASFPKVMNEMKMSAEEVTNAGKEFGVDAKTFLERRAKAIGYYNNTTGFEQNATRIGNHMGGIDFGKAVDVVKVDGGTEVYAWHVQGDPIGNYATREVVQPSQVGVGPFGRAGKGSVLPEGTITPREVQSLEVSHDTYALESTSHEYFDTRSLKPEIGADGRPKIPIDEPPGLKTKFDFDREGVNRDWLQYAPGGEKQLLFDAKTLRIKP